MTEKVNGEGMTFAEWDAAARLGEERKVAPIVNERVAAIIAALALGGAEAARALPFYGDPHRGLRLSEKRARAAWRAGEDPAEYAAAPRPLPGRTA